MEDHEPAVAGSSKHTDLNLVEMGLERIPPRYFLEVEGFYSPRNVRRLNISRNNFVHITGLSTFSNLVSLDVSNNGLSFIPDDVGSMPHMRTLIARNNNLEDLPKTLVNAQSLEAVYLSGNRLETIPEVLFDLPNVKVLHMGGNRIESLPYQIGTMLSLEILYLGGNQLKDVPASIGRLSSLSSLALCDNMLESIPSTLGDLTNLQSLSLHNNNLKTLPTEIIQLQNLQQLSLRNNPLVHNFVHNMSLDPPKLKELAGRIVRLKMHKLPIDKLLPRELITYLYSANQCVNPNCKGVYFEACVEHVKFVDFCGKYRVPLLQFLCSPTCSTSSPAYADSSSDSDEDGSNYMKMRKVLLG